MLSNLPGGQQSLKSLKHTRHMLAVCAMPSGQTANRPVAAVSDAQKTFALMKTLAGNWQGSVTRSMNTGGPAAVQADV